MELRVKEEYKALQRFVDFIIFNISILVSYRTNPYGEKYSLYFFPYTNELFCSFKYFSPANSHIEAWFNIIEYLDSLDPHEVLNGINIGMLSIKNNIDNLPQRYENFQTRQKYPINNYQNLQHKLKIDIALIKVMLINCLKNIFVTP